MLVAPYLAFLAAVVSAKLGHVKLDFESTKKGNELAKRSGSAEISILTMPDYYQASLNIGSEKDSVQVLIDTGSSDLWLMQTDVDCIPSPQSDGGAACSVDGTFDASGSSTFKQVSNAPVFNITYGDGTFATGYYGLDSVTVGEASVPQCTFGVVNKTTSSFGVFGIGLVANEAGMYGYNGSSFAYPNFPVLLKTTGVTYKNVYSLYLNSEEATSGSVLFGAVDHNKYYGTLQTVPIINEYPKVYAKPVEFTILVDSLTLQGAEESAVLTSSPFHALLDSGTTITQLPPKVVHAVNKLMQGTYNETEGFNQVSCDYMTNTDSMIFSFSGAQINVPFSDLVITDGTNCFLALEDAEVGGSGNTYSILGDNFLRHAYVVYDLDDYEISLAQVKYDSAEDIDVVTSTIPSAVKAPGYSSTAFGPAFTINSVPTDILQVPKTSSTSAQSTVTSAASEAAISSAASPSVSSGVSSATSVSKTGPVSVGSILSSVSASSVADAGSVSSVISAYGNVSTTSTQSKAFSAAYKITIPSAVSESSSSDIATSSVVAAHEHGSSFTTSVSLSTSVSTSLVNVVLTSTVVVPCDNGSSSTTSSSLSTSVSTSLVDVVLTYTVVVPCEGESATTTSGAWSTSTALSTSVSTSLVNVVLTSTVVVPCDNGLSSTTSFSLSTSVSTSLVNVVVASTVVVPCETGSTATPSTTSVASIASGASGDSGAPGAPVAPAASVVPGAPSVPVASTATSVAATGSVVTGNSQGGIASATTLQTVASSAVSQSSSTSPVVTMVGSSGIKSAYLTNAVMLFAGCAALFAYF